MSTIPTPSARSSAPARTRRRSPGTANRAPHRNEVKTRLSDPEYEALLLFQRLHGIESASNMLRRCVQVALFGLVGSLPAEISGVCAEAAQVGPHQ